MDCIPFFIAILLLIILVNVNIKEGFSQNVSTNKDLIDNNISLLKSGLNSFQSNYLKDFNNNITVRINQDYDNIYDISENDTTPHITFSKYQYDYTQANNNIPVVLNDKLEMWIDVSYTNIINTISYESLLQSITSSQYIKDNINGTSLTKTEDITEYKMVMISLNILNDIKLDYDKFHNTFNDYFSNVSGLNLLEYHQSIVEIIRSIEFITPTLFEVCIPYFNSGETDYDLSTITLNGDNYYNMIKTKYTNVDNYDRIINNYTKSFNNLLRPNI
jgi:hypothetical protein